MGGLIYLDLIEIIQLWTFWTFFLDILLKPPHPLMGLFYFFRSMYKLGDYDLVLN